MENLSKLSNITELINGGIRLEFQVGWIPEFLILTTML